jgi:plasmid rolling circle replication initiator protein Rep
MSLDAIIRHSGSDVCCLDDLSPRDACWKLQKRQASLLADLYEQTVCFDKYAQRIRECANRLYFAFESSETLDELFLKLYDAKFCRVRHCPVCQGRRSKMWIARMRKAMPKILEDYPKISLIFLTLTVRNCDLIDLRETIAWMNKSWEKLTKRKQFPGIGFIKATEVTRSSNGQAHPHFHCILAVQPTYFGSRYYLNQTKWTDLWKSCLRVDYNPVVHVRVVRSKKAEVTKADQLMSGIVEVLKYSIKPGDLVNSPPSWIEELTRQLHKTRSISQGGVFKDYMSEKEPEDLIGDSLEEADSHCNTTVRFDWEDRLSQYIVGE